jgi:tRNA/tmRNA/rRNA uracil-C5-methylase (TrmA/RlmC/RlmD family)
MEIIPEAIEDAKVNAAENGIKNSTFAAGNADDLIFSMVKQATLTKTEDIVAIVDPPRAGLQVNHWNSEGVVAEFSRSLPDKVNSAAEKRS